MEVFMFRKVVLASFAALLVAGSVTAVPANAATKISNGVACSKSGSTTKVGGYSYKCAKNPLVKNSKLTWLSTDCIKTADTYLKSKANLPKIKLQTETTIAKLKSDAAVQKVEAEKAAAFITDYTHKIEVIQKAIDSLKTDMTKNAATITKYENAIASYKAAIKAYGTVGKQIARTDVAIAQAEQTYTDAQSEVTLGLTLTQAVCKNGN
jgi:hypothetical protein